MKIETSGLQIQEKLIELLTINYNEMLKVSFKDGEQKIKLSISFVFIIQLYTFQVHHFYFFIKNILLLKRAAALKTLRTTAI